MSGIDQLFEAGVHYGYSRTRRHPTTAPFIYTTKNRIDIINLEDTEAQLQKAQSFIKELRDSGKTILWVGIKPEAQKVIEETGLALGMPFVTERWVGGTLTNFSEIKRRLAELASLKEKRATGELEKYTKKERLLIDRSIEKMEKNFGGIANMTRLPDAAIVIDPKREHIAMEELAKAHIPTITLANTDCNISNLKHVIVGNDASRSSIVAIVNYLKEAYKQ